ncbi:MAG TPA: hypothetical protein PKE47_07295 [Verrucomicrobiota bacterium]|nr:hypothetical protein [Verrucomicrobiota bacterium]
MSLLLAAAGGLTPDAPAQTVNSGSTGADGDLILVGSGQTVIDMADHPDGVYHYRSVRIGRDAGVNFIPNVRNAPVTWLVQGDCVIEGKVNLDGGPGLNGIPGRGGPGGFAGGAGTSAPTAGFGPGGGSAGISNPLYSATFGGNGSHGSRGDEPADCTGDTQPFRWARAGATYGSPFLLPLIGG